MFLDTSGLFALLSSKETSHVQARVLFEQSANVFVHNYVLAEIVALANARRIARSSVLDFISALVTVPEVTTVWVDEPLHARAMQLLRERADKSYSLCDAVIFVVMRERNLTSALTTDQHFVQGGFREIAAVSLWFSSN